LGITNAYIEIGYCSEEMLPTYLCSGDIFALSMKKNFMNETRWPNKIGEYMASGRPTVVSDVGDVAEVVEKNGIGLVAKPDVDSFAEKMQILFSNEKAADDMGVRAREVACEKYSWAEMATRLEKIYFQFLKPVEK
jgi:glycosyltransferase involved in cell wall biosynthesis